MVGELSLVKITHLKNVIRVIQGFCGVQKEATNKLVYVGYDRRSNSEDISKLVARVLASSGFEVKLSQSFCPTPCISLAG